MSDDRRVIRHLGFEIMAPGPVDPRIYDPAYNAEWARRYIAERYVNPTPWTTWPSSYAVALQPELSLRRRVGENVRFVLMFLRRHGGDVARRRWHG